MSMLAIVLNVVMVSLYRIIIAIFVVWLCGLS